MFNFDRDHDDPITWGDIPLLLQMLTQGGSIYYDNKPMRINKFLKQFDDREE